MTEKKFTIIASEEDFEELMTYVKEQQETGGGFQSVSPADGFATVTDELKQYDADVFLEKARDYLQMQPMDLVQAGKKIWDAMVFTVKKAYLAIEVEAVSHAANRVLFMAAAELFDTRTAIRLSQSWYQAEKCHTNFYENLLEAERIREALEFAKHAVDAFKKIDLQQLRIKFNELMAGQTNGAVIKIVSLPKPQTKILGGINYTVKYKCH